MASKVFILAGGGTGGHLYPAIAVAEELISLDPHALPVFACSERPIDREILSQTQFAFFTQPIRPISKSPAKWPGMIKAWIKSVALSRRVINDLKPSAVLGLGGFAAGAMCKAAADDEIPTAMINPDAIPGKANRYLAGIVEKIFTQFEGTEEFVKPECHEKLQVVGCPVRRMITSGDRREALEFFGLDGDKMTLLVFGGSAIAESLLLAIDALAEDFDEFADTWQIILPTGKKYAGQMAKAFEKRHIKVSLREYCERMDFAYAAADLVLARGGAGTVAELAATATPAVILPYPYHADRQQYLNAAGLVKAGAAIVVDDLVDPQSNAKNLRKTLLDIMRNTDKLQTMSEAAKSHAQSNAAHTIAKWLLDNS